VRSRDGGASLGARGSRDGCTEGNSASHVPEARSDIPERLTTRDAVDDFMTAIANMNAREPDAEQEAHARGPSGNAIGVVERNDDSTESPASNLTPEDFLSAMLSSRDLSSEQGIQARGLWDVMFEVGLNVLNQVLRRDVDPGHLAARDSAEDFVNSILSSRDTDTSTGFDEVLNALASSRRDVAAESADELAARNDWEDLAKMLNTRELGFQTGHA
jgi:hypothetical protein